MNVEKATADYDCYFWNFAFAYGGRAEIVDAAKTIAKKVQDNELKIDDVNESTFEKYLYTSHMTKQDPDMIIRTSGEERLSGFLLWQAAYSELLLLRCLLARLPPHRLAQSDQRYSSIENADSAVIIYARFLALTIDMTSRSLRLASSPILRLSRASTA